MLNRKRPLISTPSSPRIVNPACNIGPTTKPKTCASETIEIAHVLSLTRVAADIYERAAAILAKIVILI